MTNLTMDNIKNGLINISEFNTSFENGSITLVDDTLIRKIYELVVNGDGYAVCYGVNKVLSKHGLDVHSKGDADIARSYLEGLFRKATGLINLHQYTPIDTEYDHIAKMDVDGYNVNKSFTPNDDHTESREFVTTKCVHFDAATPFIANLYGPSENIEGGHPIICDTRSFCAEKDVDPIDLIENIPNNYNVAVKKEYYQDILDNYSVGLKLDQENDVIMIVLHNEVIGGVAHAATNPVKIDDSKPARRPIRHVEYQFANADDLKTWYDHYKLLLEKATDSKNTKVELGLDEYHNLKHRPFDNFVEVRG